MERNSKKYKNENNNSSLNLIKELAKLNEEYKSFAYIVSHDLRAPLRAIQGYTSILSEDINDDKCDELKPILGKILASVAQMNVLVSDLVEYSRVVSHEKQEEIVNITSIIDSVLVEFKIKMQDRNIVIDKNICAERLFSDRYFIRKMLYALISNAIKFSYDNSVVYINTYLQDEGFVIEVVDNGIGIELKNQNIIFEIFERLHGIESYTGSGTGLAIVKKASEILGCSYGVKSDINNGSCFWVKFNNTK